LSAGNVRPAPQIFTPAYPARRDRTLQTLHCYEFEKFRGISSGIRAAFFGPQKPFVQFRISKAERGEKGKAAGSDGRSLSAFADRGQ
jgi:hypothetical protein